MKSYGCQSMVTPIRRLALKHPRQAYQDQAHIDDQWRSLNYPGRTDYDIALAEYEELVTRLSSFGMELHFLPDTAATGLDSIYAHDPVIVADGGVIIGNMGKAARRPEPAAAGEYLGRLDIPILGQITGEGLMEGGDVLWMDERTLAVGEGYRTNAEGIRQLRHILGEAVDEILAVPLPHWTGPADCLHLMSFISLVDHDLAVVYSRLMPVPFRQWLLARGIQLIEVPDQEYDTFACNVLAVAPRQCVMLTGNPITQQRLEDAGATVWTFKGHEICLNGGGGPTCLTRPLLRQ